MAVTQLNTRIDQEVKRAIEDYCRSHGILINHFVQEALLDRLEELKDIEDLKALRHESRRPLADVVRELGLDDEL